MVTNHFYDEDWLPEYDDDESDDEDMFVSLYDLQQDDPYYQYNDEERTLNLDEDMMTFGDFDPESYPD